MIRFNGHGLVVYPRAYNKRGPLSLHSVRGVDINGKEINVKLRVDSELISANAPSIAEFSRVDIKARQPCLASENNCYSDREGVLFFTGAHFEGKSSKGIDSYIAKWAHVLASNKESPDPIIGIGRVEMVHNDVISQTLLPSDNMPARTPLGWDSKFYGLIYRYDWSESLPAHLGPNELAKRVAALLDSFSVESSMLGFMFRAIDDGGRIIRQTYAEHFPLKLSNTNSYESSAQFSDRVCSKLFEEGVSSEWREINVMPLIKIRGSSKFQSENNEPKRLAQLREIYRDKLSLPTICHIATEIAEHPETGSCLLAGLYPMSAPLGHPARLDSQGRLSFRFNDEPEAEHKDWRVPATLSGAKIGLTHSPLPNQPILMLLDSCLSGYVPSPTQASKRIEGPASATKEKISQCGPDVVEPNPKALAESCAVDPAPESMCDERPGEAIEPRSEDNAANDKAPRENAPALTGLAAFINRV